MSRAPWVIVELSKASTAQEARLRTSKKTAVRRRASGPKSASLPTPGATSTSGAVPILDVIEADAIGRGDEAKNLSPLRDLPTDEVLVSGCHARSAHKVPLHGRTEHPCGKSPGCRPLARNQAHLRRVDRDHQ